MLVATTTPDEVMPNAAPLVAHELGAMRAGAFDIGAACTGFLSALAVGTGQIEAGRAQCVVVIGADLMSRILDPEDRTTAAVFADGAGAVVLQATGEASRIGPIVLGADGAGADHIIVPRAEGVIRMRGHETFREAVARLSLVDGPGRPRRRRPARRHRPVRLPPGQRTDPERGRRAARACRPTASSTASPITATRRRRRCRSRSRTSRAPAG